MAPKDGKGFPLGPPSARDPDPSRTFLGQGNGPPARQGVPARGFLRLWAVWEWEYHEAQRGPLSSRDSLPLLVHGLFGALQKRSGERRE